MQPIYRVLIGEIHVVKSTLNYLEAKQDFLVWIETLKTQTVSFNMVTLTKDHEIIMEYIKNA